MLDKMWGSSIPLMSPQETALRDKIPGKNGLQGIDS
jgi:hypothetical protein